ncbi:MAG: glycerate-2-kinase family protein, partial [Deltaproteobacteria bacterium]|nr:glycerate-2-kinase family protein [Kofleriaceae bacterium]
MTVWRAAVAACDPRRVVKEACAGMAAPARIVAFGKAAGAMAAGAIDVFGPRDGLVVTVDGVEVPDVVTASGLHVRRAGHPVPDARSEAAGREVIELMQRVRAGERVLVLVSGGASALVAVPRDGIDLAAKIVVVAQVMRRGAPIAELNRVRTELSAVKGGKLAAMCPGQVVTLVASDVPGDDVSVVGSGPTVPGKPGDEVRLLAGIGRFRREAALALQKLSKLPPSPSPSGDGGNFDNFSGTEEREGVLEGTAEEVAAEVERVARTLE